MIDPTQVPNRPPWPVINDRSIADNIAPGPTIKVRCIHPQGIYYLHQRRREGDTFLLHPLYVAELDKFTRKAVKVNGEIKKSIRTAEGQFSASTMERVESDDPLTLTSAQQALDKAHEEISSLKRRKEA